MTKEEALKLSKENGYKFLYNHPKWNNDKEIVMAAVKQNGIVLQYASYELKNDKEVALASAQYYEAFEYITDELKKDRDVVLCFIKNDTYVCRFSLLDEYKNFDEVIEKEGDEFLFSCWNNLDWKTRLCVANHPNFLPTLEQIEIGLQDIVDMVKNIYQLRQDEWISKIEEHTLRNIM